jgi:cell division protein FtsQ
MIWMLTGAVVVSAGLFKYHAPISELIIEIEALPFGKNLVDEQDIQQQLMDDFKTSFEGWKMKEIDARIIEKSVRKNAFVKDAHVYVDALNRLHIVVYQREPVLRVQDENAMSFYLDQEGNYMPLSRHYTARVKVASGNIPRFTGVELSEADTLYTALFKISTIVGQDPFFEALVEQIYVDRNRDIYLSPKVGNQRVLIGDERDVEDKLKKLHIFLKEGLAYEGWQACEVIDLRFDDQIVCKKRDEKYSIKTQ